MTIKMEKIKATSNFEDKVVYLKLDNKKELTSVFPEFFTQLGLAEVDDFDLFYPEFDEEYIFHSDKVADIHLFVTKKFVHLAISLKDISREKVYSVVEKYFQLP